MFWAFIEQIINSENLQKMKNEQMINAESPAQIDGKPNVGCWTSMTELIQWCILNAFNIEGQDGTKYVAIDYEEMQSQMDYFLEKEKKQIVDAVEWNYKSNMGEVYYNALYSNDVSV